MKTGQPSAVVSSLALTVVLSACPGRHPAGLERVADSTGPALSVLEPGAGGCTWSKLDLGTGKRSTVATLPGSCRGAKLVLSRDQRRAAVWFDPGEWEASYLTPGAAFHDPAPRPPSTSRIFALEPGSDHVTVVPVPPELRDLGFDARGRLVALTVHELTKTEIEKGEVVVDGATLKLGPAAEGTHFLVHAFAFEAGAWKRFETARGGDLTLGVSTFEAAEDLGFRSTEVLKPFIQGDDEIDQGLLGKLARYAPQAHPVEGQGNWIRFGSGDTWFEVWEVSGELAFATGLVAFLDRDKNPVKPPGWPFTEKDVLSYSWNGPYLLAALDSVGSHPRLYKNGALAWSSDTAKAVTFWPQVKTTDSPAR